MVAILLWVAMLHALGFAAVAPDPVAGFLLTAVAGGQLGALVVACVEAYGRLAPSRPEKPAG